MSEDEALWPRFPAVHVEFEAVGGDPCQAARRAFPPLTWMTQAVPSGSWTSLSTVAGGVESCRSTTGPVLLAQPVQTTGASVRRRIPTVEKCLMSNLGP